MTRPNALLPGYCLLCLIREVGVIDIFLEIVPSFVCLITFAIFQKVYETVLLHSDLLLTTQRRRRVKHQYIVDTILCLPCVEFNFQNNIQHIFAILLVYVHLMFRHVGGKDFFNFIKQIILFTLSRLQSTLSLLN